MPRLKLPVICFLVALLLVIYCALGHYQLRASLPTLVLENLLFQPILSQAKTRVVVDNNALSISRIYVSTVPRLQRQHLETSLKLWRNDMPSMYSTPEEAKRVAYPRPAHIVLQIASEGSPDSLNDPSLLDHIIGLHIFRLAHAGPSLAGVQGDANFSWTVGDHGHKEATAEVSWEPTIEITYNNHEDTIQMAARYGPRMGGKKVEYVAVVEFQGNVFLRSKAEKLQISE